MPYCLLHGSYMHFPDTTIADVMRFTYLFRGAEAFFKANLFSTSQEISLILWNPKFHCRTYKIPPPVRILSTAIHCQYLMYALHWHCQICKYEVHLGETNSSGRRSRSLSRRYWAICLPQVHPIYCCSTAVHCQYHSSCMHFTSLTLQNFVLYNNKGAVMLCEFGAIRIYPRHSYMTHSTKLKSG